MGFRVNVNNQFCLSLKGVLFLKAVMAYTVTYGQYTLILTQIDTEEGTFSKG